MHASIRCGHACIDRVWALGVGLMGHCDVGLGARDRGRGVHWDSYSAQALLHVWLLRSGRTDTTSSEMKLGMTSHTLEHVEVLHRSPVRGWSIL